MGVRIPFHESGHSIKTVLFLSPTT